MGEGNIVEYDCEICGCKVEDCLCGEKEVDEDG